MQRILQLAPSLLALGLVAAAGAWGGWTIGRAPLQVALSDLRSAHATEAAGLAEGALQRLQAAQARADALAASLAAIQAQNNRLSKEKTRALQNQTSGRACLSADALRVLNDAPGLDVDGLPAPSGGAATAGEPTATDTDIGTWAIAAGAQYQACGDQLNALIDWHTPAPEQGKLHQLANPDVPKVNP